ncbi:bacteriocin [Mangrovibacterium sp.]|uniref:bacteriocin n=1 Tax=Mangrovibacterium sp. TaxID=1961364 RepID=UPI0035648282
MKELDKSELKCIDGGDFSWRAYILGAFIGAMSESGWYANEQIEAAGYTAYKNA